MRRPLAFVQSFGSAGQTVALLLGAGGGLLFTLAHIPLAWMLGSMTVVAIAALNGVHLTISTSLRNLMLIVLGALLGSSFQPELFESVSKWGFSIAGLAAYMALSIAGGTFFFRKVLVADRPTAYFAATPGGMSEMVVVGAAFGAQPQTVALCHSARIVIVVFTVPLAFAFIFPFVVGVGPSTRAPIAPFGMADAQLLAMCAVGALAGRLLRIPAAWIMGPMLISAGIHLAGLTTALPPAILVNIAQLVVGSSIGCLFRDFDRASMLRTGFAAAGLTAILLVLSLICACVVHSLTGLPIKDLLLAYSPAGFTEMALVSVAVNADTAFVAVHHMIRITMVTICAPLLFRLVGSKARPGCS